MSRGSKVALGVILIALVVGIGYYTAYTPTGGPSVECIASFDRLDAPSKDQQLNHEEFFAYGEGVTRQDFAKADMDANQALSSQEFCRWYDTGTKG